MNFAGVYYHFDGMNGNTESAGITGAFGGIDKAFDYEYNAILRIYALPKIGVSLERS